MGRRHPLLERLTPGASGPPLVLDGAQGTALLDARPSALPPLPVDLLNLEDPDRVIGLHRAHLAAGAQVLRTNTFNACERALGGRGVGAGSSAVAEAGARAARVAAREAGVDPLILGVVGPGEGADGEDRGRLEGLLRGGVHGVLVETLGRPDQARGILGAVRDVDARVPLLVSFTPPKGGPRGGLPALDGVVDAAEDFEVTLLGLNCGHGPEDLERTLAPLRARWGGALGAWPNAGLPVREGRAWRWPVGPDELGRWCAEAARRHGLRLVGGCCGTSGGHVAAVARALDQSGGTTRD